MTPRHFRALAAALCAIVALVGFAVPLRGQDRTSSGPLPAALDIHLGVTDLAHVAAGEAGIAASLALGGGFRLGGGAWSVLRRVDEGPALEGTGLELSLGYGGAFAEYALGRIPLSARLLVGGGFASLRTLAVGSRYDTETFVVLEPGLVGSVDLPGPFALGGLVGYRRVEGVEPDFLGADESLHGVRAAVFLRVGR